MQGVLASMVSILGPVIALRYPMAIVVTKDEKDSPQLVSLSLMVALGLSCLLGLILLFWQGQILRLFGVETLGRLIWFLPLALFCVALQEVMDYRAARIGAFRLVGIATVVVALLGSIARISAGLIAPMASSLIAVFCVAPAVQAAILWTGIRRKTEQTIAPLTWEKAKNLLSEHRDFPVYRMPNDVLNSASQAVPVIMLAALFSPMVAGLYTLTRSVLNLPSNIIGNAIGSVVYARFAELYREGGDLAPLLIRVTAALMSLAPLIIGLTWFAPWVFALVFGEEWRDAGYYARWMSLWIGVSIANIPVVRVIPVIGRQKAYLMFNAIFLLVRVLSVLVPYWAAGSALIAVAWFSITSAIMNVIIILLFGWQVIRIDHARRRASSSQDPAYAGRNNDRYLPRFSRWFESLRVKCLDSSIRREKE